MKLIDKDALVAEIEKLKSIQLSVFSRGETEESCYDSLTCISVYNEILSSLDTLEVKEVDLEEVFNDEYSKFSNDTDAGDYAIPIDLADYRDFAKHFFELGMAASNNAQKCESSEQLLAEMRGEEPSIPDIVDEHYYEMLEEEPVIIKKGCKYRCLSDMVNKDTGNISFIGDKIYLAPEDNALVSEENEWLCDTSENASNFELVEEPVSDELEEASGNYADNEEYGDDVYFAIKAAFEAGANWQRGKDIKCYFEERKHIVDEAYRIGIEMGKISMKQLMEQDPNLVVKTKEEYDADLAIQYQKGMNGMKALMMKNAITAKCFGAQSGDALFSIRLPAKGYLVGSEIKVIIIKEENV